MLDQIKLATEIGDALAALMQGPMDAIVVAAGFYALQWWRERRKDSAAVKAVEASARKDEAQADAQVSSAWAAFAADLRQEMAQRDRRCEERLAALTAELAKSEHRVRNLSSIIVALVTKRRLTAEQQGTMAELTEWLETPPPPLLADPAQEHAA